MKLFPKARTEKLVVQDFNDELLVYDRQRHKAHCLNRTAALVWNHCDGRTSVEDISRHLKNEIDGEVVVDERLVWYALRQFERDHLLEEKLDITAGVVASDFRAVGRRRVMKLLGLTAVALPLVTSMVAPTAAQAASCLGPGAACTASAQCCNGLCNGGTCA